MSRLSLVKHALPEIAPSQPSRSWLSCSSEPQASGTADILCAMLGLAPVVVPGLEEHHRTAAGYLGHEAFQRVVASFFATPDRLVFGEEKLDAAYARFGAPDEMHIVVAHGTVITLFVSRRAGVAPFPLWQRLGLPSAVVLELPMMRLAAAIDSVVA